VFKVGLELFSAAGPDAVRAVCDRGCDVFLDLKINDIPKQAAGAVRSATKIGVRYVTAHSNGGRAMVRAAVEAAGDERITVLVVSVLTSLDDDDLRDVGVHRSAADQVQAMAALAADEGAPGLVLAAREVAAMRSLHPDLFLVTPGIRPATAEVGDQRRVGTPAAAIEAGADMLVVGRPVTDAADPRSALAAITLEIAQSKQRQGAGTA
jgi:orotidine-5'-phosphate decarboxylase